MKFFSKFKDAIKNHSAGATVRHRSPFDDLAVPKNEQDLSSEEIQTWVAPHYMKTLGMEFDDSILELSRDITESSVIRLLGDFNWRTRSMGATYTLLKNLRENEKIICNLLLKSEVCYSGVAYSYVLAAFGTDLSISTLKKYLSYYLTQKKLFFDQRTVLDALIYLDLKNGTKEHAEFLPVWESFLSNKPNWDKSLSNEGFSNTMENLLCLQKQNLTNQPSAH